MLPSFITWNKRLFWELSSSGYTGAKNLEYGTNKLPQNVGNCHAIIQAPLLHSRFPIADVQTIQHSYDILHFYRDVLEDSGLLEGDCVSTQEWFPTFWRNMAPSTSRVRQCKKHNISKELWPFEKPDTTHQTSVAPQEDLNPHNIPNATTVLQITSKQDSSKWNQTQKYN